LLFYKYVNWLYPIGRALYPKGFITLTELGHAMINTVNVGNERRVLEGTDIIELAKRK